MSNNYVIDMISKQMNITKEVNMIVDMYNDLKSSDTYSPTDFQTIDRANYILSMCYQYDTEPEIQRIIFELDELIEYSEEEA